MNDNDERQELGQDLLPGWSALVVMLMIFGVLSAITLMTLLHGDDSHIDAQEKALLKEFQAMIANGTIKRVREK